MNSVSPGLLLTEWGLQFPASKVEKTTEKSPLKRVATVEVRKSMPTLMSRIPVDQIQDVAQQILFLANSASTTGTNSVLDAGVSL